MEAEIWFPFYELKKYFYSRKNKFRKRYEKELLKSDNLDNNKQQNPSPRIDKKILVDFFMPKNIFFRHSGRYICIQGKAIDFRKNQIYNKCKKFILNPTIKVNP